MVLNSKSVGNKIATARKNSHLSQAELAEQVSISAQAVGKWERGESMPDITTLNRLAELLGVDLNYFSENFQSVASESTIGEFSEQKTVMEPSATNKKNSWDMSKGNWVDADFSGLKNLHEKFSSSNMQRCKFIGSDLSGLLLGNNNITACDFSGSNISKSTLKGSYLQKNVFANCLLNETAFSGSHILGCNFAEANFTGVTFKSGGFEKNTTTNAVWNQTSFNEMYLADIVFEGTINDCSFDHCSFKRVKFENAVITNTFFKNRSLKGITFINCKADHLTYEFLKNGKADLSGVERVI